MAAMAAPTATGVPSGAPAAVVMTAADARQRFPAGVVTHVQGFDEATGSKYVVRLDAPAGPAVGANAVPVGRRRFVDVFRAGARMIIIEKRKIMSDLFHCSVETMGFRRAPAMMNP